MSTAVLSESATERWRKRRDEIGRHQFRHVERVPLSEWIEEYGRLPEGDAEPGPYRLDRTPYMREILDTISGDEYERIVIMKGTQLGLTVGFVLAALYYVHQRPSRILQALPSSEYGRKWSREKLTPILDAMPDEVSSLIGEGRTRDTTNTILTKSFPNGFLSVIGAESPRQLRMTSAPIVFMDEVDGFPASAGSEGDPVNLLIKRTQTYRRRKIIENSSPTIKGLSRIERDFDNSDQRHLYVPCPHCGWFQVLKWGGPDTEFGIKWDTVGEDGSKQHRPETAVYMCEECKCLIEESEKRAMLAEHEWRPHNPGHKNAGFHLPSFYSLFPRARWQDLVTSFLESKGDPLDLQVWVNTIKGETWEEKGTSVDGKGLGKRTEVWVGDSGDRCDVPTGVGLLTAGIDVQLNRLELEVDGWGDGEESWTIAHHRIWGDTESDETWARLEALLVKRWRHQRGGDMLIACTMIDSRYAKDAVYRFVRPREARMVFAAQGLGGQGKDPLSRAMRKTSDDVTLFSIGTDAMKDKLFRRLQLKTPGPGFIHFAAPGEDGLDAEYFAQFAGERKVRRRKKGSRAYVSEYVQVRDRNEAIDLKVLNLAALHALGMGARMQLGELAEKAGVPRAKGQSKRRGRVRSRGVE